MKKKHKHGMKMPPMPKTPPVGLSMPPGGDPSMGGSALPPAMPTGGAPPDDTMM